MSIEQTAQALMEAMKSKSQPTAYDSQATVTRVDGDTLWVHIPGGVDETPIQRTIDASEGDVVQVRVSDGNAFAVGNASAPPTDDTAANAARKVADNANKTADNAQRSAEIAEAAAEQALDSAATAAIAAASAQTSADSAQESAQSALTQLSVVEDVVGTLNWISEHGTYVVTADTEVVHGKMYFTRTGSGTTADPYVYSVIANPTGNPSTQGYYELDSIDEAVSNYVSSHLALTDEGLYVIKDGNGWRVLIKNDGVYIIDTSGAVVSQYKDSVTIGKSTQSKAVIDYHSLQMVDKDGLTYFNVSDLRSSNGRYSTYDDYVGDGTETYYACSFTPISDTVVVTLDGNVTTAYTLYPVAGTTDVSFNSAPGDGVAIHISYDTESTLAKAYTFGLRGTGKVAGYSVAEGYLNVASGLYSHAEGSQTTASGEESHAEGEGTIAIGGGSHAEGVQTTATNPADHAEGILTVASGQASHAEGIMTQAVGGYSHAEGEGTVARGNRQHVSGRWNVADTNDSYAVIVGNGTDDSNRSNALTVDWNGNVVAAGDVTANGVSLGALNRNKANVNNPSLVFGIGNNTGSNPASSTPRVEFRRSGNATNGYALSIVVVGSTSSKIYELVETDGTFALPIYKGNISTMVSLYNHAITYGALYFTGPASLWQALTKTTNNYYCYGYAVVDGTSVSYTVHNGPGGAIYCGRLSSATTINRLYLYSGTSVV